MQIENGKLHKMDVRAKPKELPYLLCWLVWDTGRRIWGKAKRR